MTDSESNKIKKLCNPTQEAYTVLDTDHFSMSIIFDGGLLYVMSEIKQAVFYGK